MKMLILDSVTAVGEWLIEQEKLRHSPGVSPVREVEMLHEGRRVAVNDKWFVVGGNPDKSGGGVIETFNDLAQAQALAETAIKMGYTKVRVMTYKQLFEEYTHETD